MEELILIDILEQEGVQFKDEDEKYRILNELKRAVDNGQFHFIIKNGVKIGFFCYKQVFNGGKAHTFIDNLLIYKKFRKPTALLSMRKYFKDMGNRERMKFYFWYSRRRDRFTYVK